MSLAVHPGAKALIFDLDGTLLDTMAAHFQAWREAVAPYGIEIEDELFRELGGKTSHDIVKVLNLRFCTKLDEERLAIEKDQAYVRQIALVQPFPVVLDLLERYHGVLPLAAATNESLGVANIVLRTTGLFSLFDLLVTPEDVEHPKPAPDLFLHCAAQLGLEPGQCQVFEDSPTGLAAASAAGMIVTDVKPYL